MAEQLVAGAEYTAVVVEALNRTHLVQYAAASGDYHPVHHDDTYAQAIGFPSVFAHGMLTMGLTGRFLEQTVGRGTLTHYTARLVGQVWPGDRLTATLTVTAVDGGIAELAVQTVNQDGAVVLAGSAAARTDAATVKGTSTEQVRADRVLSPASQPDEPAAKAIPGAAAR